MSVSSENTEVSAHKSARFSEKPSFSQKCSMLSQYLKEKGSFGDLSLGMARTIEPNGATMNFFPAMESQTNTAASRDLKFMNLFPQQAGFSSPRPEREAPKMADYSLNKPATGELERSQMTIFYGGQVIVLNDFPADKAKELMLLASQESSHNLTAQASNQAKSNNAFPFNMTKNPFDSGVSVSPSPTVVPSFVGKAIQESVQPTASPNVCDLPIARKASLHRFLEKRKDRINARAPYQIPEVAASKSTEGNSWLGLAAQRTQ
ncbi:hypothetical protein CsatA_019564 [Cannabis sativa]